KTRQRSEFRIRRIHKNGSVDNRARKAHPPRSMNRTPCDVTASTRKVASAITPPRDGDQATLVTNPTSRPSFDTRSPWTGARSPSTRRPSSFRRPWPSYVPRVSRYSTGFDTEHGTDRRIRIRPEDLEVTGRSEVAELHVIAHTRLLEDPKDSVFLRGLDVEDEGIGQRIHAKISEDAALLIEQE